MNKFNWRHQYDDTDDMLANENTKVYNDQPSLTQQQFANDANLNTIVQRFGIRDGSINPAPLDPSYYGDFTGAPDFRQALDQVRDAEEKFAALPADVRTKFRNDPVELWQFVHDPRNIAESVKLGLLKQDIQAPAPAAPAAPAT